MICRRKAAIIYASTGYAPFTYWGHRFIERSNAISLSDAGFEQWHFQLIEQIESTCGEVDFALLKKIENNGGFWHNGGSLAP